MTGESASKSEYSWRKDYQLLGAGVASLLLVAAAFGEFSFGFYTFLRLSVTVAAAAVTWRSHDDGKVITAVTAAIVAILFNPILPIELDAETWTPIDILVAGWFSWLAMEGLAAARGLPILRFAPVGAGIGSVALILLIFAINETGQQSVYENPAANNIDALPQTNPFEELIPARSPEQRLANAFEVATGHRTQFIEKKDGDLVIIKPLRIIDLPFGPALLTLREIRDGCHACTGAIGIFYLKEEGEKTRLAGSWPEAVEGWGWGAPPAEWKLTNEFTENPAIYAAGGYTGQGITMSSATITELAPTGPVTSELIGTGFTNEGAIVDESETVCAVTGVITNIQKDRAFDVAVSGSVTALDHYIKKDGRFVPEVKIEWPSPCPD